MGELFLNREVGPLTKGGWSRDAEGLHQGPENDTYPWPLTQGCGEIHWAWKQEWPPHPSFSLLSFLPPSVPPLFPSFIHASDQPAYQVAHSYWTLGRTVCWAMGV